ncbi:MAG: superoxide dismutase [Marinifilaceae bacterium]|jgi:Fe-Mn family superoxide dismutase|nr:superoxide dismutase [Marinifilaceae bacterium]
MKFELPKLPYEIDGLEPFMSKETIEYHYGKHHQAYTNNLNKLIEGTEFENSPLEEIIKKSEGGIFNNAAQYYNHTFFFEALKVNGVDAPKGELAKLIEKKYGCFESFKEQFSAKAATLFGSGWTWLIVDADGELDIMQTSNAGTPIREDLKPLMCIDVWEHAYYIDYRNARPSFISKFWEIINWEVVESRL